MSETHRPGTTATPQSQPQQGTRTHEPPKERVFEEGQDESGACPPGADPRTCPRDRQENHSGTPIGSDPRE